MNSIKYSSVMNDNNLEAHSFNIISSSTPKPALTPPLQQQQAYLYSGSENLCYQSYYHSPTIASTSTPIQTSQAYSLYTNSTPIISQQYTQQTQNYYIDQNYQYQNNNNIENSYSYSQHINNNTPSQFIDSNYFSKTHSILGSYQTNYDKTPSNRNQYNDDDSAVYESPVNSTNTKTNKLFTIDSILNDKRTECNNNKENLIPLLQQQKSEEQVDENTLKGGKKGGRNSSKRIRTIFTQEQLDRLEVEFMKQQYMVGSERYYLANELNLNEAQVKIWFQNRRIKWRKENVEQKRSVKCNKQQNDDNSLSYQPPQSPSLNNESISN